MIYCIRCVSLTFIQSSFALISTLHLSFRLVPLALRILSILCDLFLIGLDLRLRDTSGTCDTLRDHFPTEWRLRYYLLAWLFMLLRFPDAYPATTTSYGRLRASILLFYWSSSNCPLEEIVPTEFLSSSRQPTQSQVWTIRHWGGEAFSNL